MCYSNYRPCSLNKKIITTGLKFIPVSFHTSSRENCFFTHRNKQVLEKFYLYDALTNIKWPFLHQFNREMKQTEGNKPGGKANQIKIRI